MRSSSDVISPERLQNGNVVPLLPFPSAGVVGGFSGLLCARNAFRVLILPGR